MTGVSSRKVADRLYAAHKAAWDHQLDWQSLAVIGHSAIGFGPPLSGCVVLLIHGFKFPSSKTRMTSEKPMVLGLNTGNSLPVIQSGMRL